jgi:hypothetical protein
MATLERVMQLKEQGMQEPEIIDTLKQEGISPKDINESLSQSKIKSALNTEIPQPSSPSGMQMTPGIQPTSTIPAPETSPLPPAPETQMQPGISSQQPQAPMQSSIEASIQPPMQQPTLAQEPSPSIPSQNIPPTQIPSSYQPATRPYDEPTQMPDSQMQSQELQPQPPTPYQEDYPQEPQEEYDDYPDYQQYQSTDIETINDIAEQIAEEKNTELKKQISSLTKFKEEINSEIQRINDRLVKIEGVFNELQIAILGKIGEYGKDIKSIAKEMYATQDSFSKILNPLTENIRELQKITGTSRKVHHKKPTHTTHKTTTHKTAKTHVKPKKSIKTHPKTTRTRKTKKPKPKIEDFVR